MMMFALLAAPAMALDAEFAEPELPEAQEAGEKAGEPGAEMSAELGGNWTTGNAEYYTVNGAAHAGYRWPHEKLAASVGANLGRAVADANGDGRLDEQERRAGLVESSRRYQAELRFDRFMGRRSSMYALAGGFVDPFAGYDLRTHQQVGWSRRLVQAKATDLRAELGFDWAQEQYVEGVEPDYANAFAARLLAGLEHRFNSAVSFQDTAELYENVVDPADMRVLNGASLGASLGKVLGVKLSHQLTWDAQPVDGFAELDSTTMLTLVASLL